MVGFGSAKDLANRAISPTICPVVGFLISRERVFLITARAKRVALMLRCQYPK